MNRISSLFGIQYPIIQEVWCGVAAGSLLRLSVMPVVWD